MRRKLAGTVVTRYGAFVMYVPEGTADVAERLNALVQALNHEDQGLAFFGLTRLVAVGTSPAPEFIEDVPQWTVTPPLDSVRWKRPAEGSAEGAQVSGEG